MREGEERRRAAMLFRRREGARTPRRRGDARRRCHARPDARAMLIPLSAATGGVAQRAAQARALCARQAADRASTMSSRWCPTRRGSRSMTWSTPHSPATLRSRDRACEDAHRRHIGRLDPVRRAAPRRATAQVAHRRRRQGAHRSQALMPPVHFSRKAAVETALQARGPPTAFARDDPARRRYARIPPPILARRHHRATRAAADRGECKEAGLDL